MINPFADSRRSSSRAGINLSLLGIASRPSCANRAALGVDRHQQRLDRWNRGLPRWGPGRLARARHRHRKRHQSRVPYSNQSRAKICARGIYLVLLNNDVVVTDGWLEQLVALTGASRAGNSEDPTHESEIGNSKSEMKIGLVGPMSNYAALPQLVESVPYHDLEEMKVFARRWREEHRGIWFTVRKLSGFCLLMKRAVYDAIGGLDERFGLGFFDDDDLAERARRAGFALAVAHDLFVHHYGSRTFVGNGVDAERVLDENARRFAAKWGDAVPQGRRVALRAWQNGEGTSADCVAAEHELLGAGLQTPPTPGPKVSPRFTGQPKINGPPTNTSKREAHAHGPDARQKPDLHPARISLTMIVENEENNIGRCLESVRGVFDEIVVVDTGSKDRTVEIARSFGARVFDFVWVDDFGAARNAALARAKGDYAFWLDADDLIEPPQCAKLEALFGRLRPGEMMPAFVVRCACDPGPDGARGDTVVDHVRLFPLIEGVRWTYRVHEQVLPALKRAGVPVEWTDITVRHTGYSDRALRFRKLERDCRILRESWLSGRMTRLRCSIWARLRLNGRSGMRRWGISSAVWGARCRVIRLCGSCMRTLRGVTKCCGIIRRRWRVARRGSRSMPRMRSCGSARRLCIGVAVILVRLSGAGGGS